MKTIYIVQFSCVSDLYELCHNSLPGSVNELLKIKDDLTKERDEKLSDIAKVGFFPFPNLLHVCVFLIFCFFFKFV